MNACRDGYSKRIDDQTHSCRFYCNCAEVGARATWAFGVVRFNFQRNVDDPHSCAASALNLASRFRDMIAAAVTPCLFARSKRAL
jgi:hypothetical protein